MFTHNEEAHPGIAVHKVPVGADVPGLLFAVGMVFIFLLAVPALSYVLAGAAVLGLGIACILRVLHRSQPFEKSYSHLAQLGQR
jgi:hypothetical protein